MTRDPEKFLHDMLDRCRFLLELTVNENIERYRSDRIFRSAIERELQCIGEALLQLRSICPEVATEITESERIIGFRHVLVHGYFSLKPTLAWEVVKNKLPVLAEEVEQLLGH